MGVFVWHSTEKTKTSKQYGSFFSLDAGTNCPKWWSSYRRSWNTSYIQGDPVHWSHVNPAMLKVNFAQTWGRGGVGACLKRSAWDQRNCVFLRWVLCLVVDMRTCAAPLRSHDQNWHPTPPIPGRFCLLLSLKVSRRTSPHTSPVSRAHGTCLLMHIQ
jgi:hypothetical protein